MTIGILELPWVGGGAGRTYSVSHSGADWVGGRAGRNSGDGGQGRACRVGGGAGWTCWVGGAAAQSGYSSVGLSL